MASSSCWVWSGLVVVLLACLCAGVGLLSPYWVGKEDGSQVGHMGLWMACETQSDGQEVCAMIPLHDTKHLQIDVWYRACQAVYTLGWLLLVVALFLICTMLCCACCSRNCLINSILTLLSISFLAVGVPVTLFAVVLEGTWNIDIEWGYWMGCAGTSLNLVALFIFFFLVCCKGS